MSRRGFKIADAYVEVHADEDALRQEVRDIPGRLGGDVDKAGADMGDRLTKGLAAKVEALSGKVASARQQEKKAADAVALAESKLNEGRQSGTAKASTLLGLEQRLSQAQDRLSLSTQRATSLERKHADAQGLLSQALKDSERDVGKAAEDLGRNAGLKIKMGMTASTSRLSPLIVAALAGGLMAGAPLMLGAVGVLFAGVGAFLALQNSTVKQAWGNTFASIKSQAISDASVLTGTMVNAALKVAAGFQSIRPQLQDAFAASGPIIDKLTTGLIGLVQNLLPGMVHALQAAGPVFDGLSVFLKDIGTGLSNFFDILAQHSGSSGAVFAQLGQLIGALLPILAQLLGAGVELASAVLPSVVSAFQLVAAILDKVAPLLPLVLGGFLAFQAVSGLRSVLDGWTKSLAAAAEKSTALAGLQGKVGSALGGLSAALPGLGLALTIVGAMFYAVSQQEDAWAAALLKGGAAAQQARAEMVANSSAAHDLNSGFTGLLSGILGYSNALGIAGGMGDQATKKMQAQLAAMDPLTRAQTLQTQALNDLNTAIEQHGAGSDAAVAAEGRYEQRTNDVKDAQNREEQAIRGVTQAMLDQAAEEDARANSDLAYRQSVIGVSEAEQSLVKVQQTRGHTAADLQKASLGVEAAMLREVEAAGKLASDALPAAIDAHQKGAIAAKAQLDELNKLATASGGTLPPNLEKMRQDLIKTTGQIDYAKVRTDIAAASLDNLGSKNPKPTLDVNPVPAQSKTRMVMDNLSAFGGMRPVPVADLNTGPARNQYNVMMGMLGTVAGQRPTPTATLIDHASGTANYIRDMINSISSRSVTVTTYFNSVGQHISGGNGPGGTSTRRTGGPIHAAGGKLVGPGDGSVDTIPAVGPGGRPWMLANREWIIQAMAAARYGDRKMAAVNAGTATVLLPSEVRSAAGATGSSASNPTTGVGFSNGGAGTSIVVQNLNVPVQAILDPTDSAAVRRVALVIEAELVKLTRERR